MKGADHAAVLEQIGSVTDLDELYRVLDAAVQRIHYLRNERLRPCMWGQCDGTVRGDNACDLCGQRYV